ncbi:MAG: CoA transferase [Rhodospirillales bacterium]|nr:MAG: CoA transferase [Rhodospirillales bacterium]
MLSTFLEGVRVLDLSQYLPGPFASRLLADMGADVVKVEPPGGEPGRRLDAGGRETVSPYYHVVNAGKRVIDLDLRSEAGQEAFAGLVESADVLLESFRPGVLDRLGFGEHRLKALNPSLVHCALSGYGQTGPLRLASGHDLNYVALTGALEATGTPETPVIPFPPMSDHAGALMAVVSILGALMARARGRGGAHLDVSLSESLLFLQELAFAFDARRGQGLLTGGSACYQIYRTADDRFITVSPLEPKFWANFCNAVGRPEWIPRQFEPLPQRALIAEVASLIGSQTLAQWERVLGEADCCYQAVVTHAEVAAHPHIQARHLVGRLGKDTEVRAPVFVDGAPPEPRREIAFSDADAVIGSWRQD